MFRTTLFEGYGLFNNAQFCKALRFTNTCFGKGGNFADVGQIASSTIWRGHNNSSVSDGATTTTPLLSNSDKDETYEEENLSQANVYAIAVGERGEWDWVVQNNGATTSATYCFRMVKSDGDVLDSYVRMPEMTVVRGLVQLRYRWRNDDGGE